MSKLKPEILNKLILKANKKESTVRKDLSILRHQFPNATLNAVAAVYAGQHGFSILRMLGKEDKASLPNFEIVHAKKVLKSKTVKTKQENYLKIQTNNIFYNKHISEINKAYLAGCYTAVNILLRKIVENMVIDILRAKYPSTSKENKELYYDLNRNVYNDFSKVLDNLYKKRIDFGIETKKIERLNGLCKHFKDDANDKTHSLYYIVERREEIDNLHVETIFALISEIAKSINLEIIKT